MDQVRMTNTGQFWGGVILIAVGTFCLFINFGLINGIFIFMTLLLLIGIGVAALIARAAYGKRNI